MASTSYSCTKNSYLGRAFESIIWGSQGDQWSEERGTFQLWLIICSWVDLRQNKWCLEFRSHIQQITAGCRMASIATASPTYLQSIDARIYRETSYLSLHYSKCIFFLSEKPTEVMKHLEDKTAAAGQDISLSCELSKPGVNIRWYKDGKAIRKSQKYDLQQEGTKAILVIHDSTVKDSGEYTCETEDSKTKARVTVQGE